MVNRKPLSWRNINFTQPTAPAPTAAPVPAPSTAPVSGTQAVARRIYTLGLQAGLPPPRATELVAAAHAESSLDPQATNKSSGAAGLFQLLSSGYRTKAQQLGGLYDVAANTRAILPDYVSYWQQHPGAAPGEAGRDVERSGEGAGFYSSPLSTVRSLLGDYTAAPAAPAAAPTGLSWRDINFTQPAASPAAPAAAPAPTRTLSWRDINFNGQALPSTGQPVQSATGLKPFSKSGGVGTVSFPDMPIANPSSVGGVHATEGLAGYPAVDIFAKPGTPVFAPEAGTIERFSGHDPALGAVQGAGGPLGWSIYLKGRSGKTYFLTHLGSRGVRVGEAVSAGQPIATVADYDKYGRPSHLHIGVSA